MLPYSVPVSTLKKLDKGNHNKGLNLVMPVVGKFKLSGNPVPNMIFLIDTTFLQNHFTEKLICDLISHPNFKIFKQIEGYFKANPITCHL